jgi:hypothetical protein
VADASGTQLFDLRNKLWALRRTFCAYASGSDEKLFSVQAELFTFGAMTVYAPPRSAFAERWNTLRAPQDVC